MHEIECILHEYLSFNWDRVEDIYDANAPYLDENGLRCSWKSHSILQAIFPPFAHLPEVVTQHAARVTTR